MSEKNRVFCKIASGEEEPEVVKKMNIAGPGYAFGIDNGSDAGQEVFHLHAHFVGCRKMGRL